MGEALRYLLAVEVVGLVAWPLVARALPALPDRGFALAKAAGLFALAVADGWLAASGVLRELSPRARTTVALLAVAALALAVASARPGPLPTLRRALAARGRALLALELVFLAVFLVGLAVRATDPGVSHTEQPMDRMLLGAVSEARDWPIEDPWLSGVPLGYYALGHAAVAAPARLTGVGPDVAYNLGLALWGALVAIGAGGLGWALARAGVPRRRRGGALFAAAGGAAILLVSGGAATRDALAQLPTLLAGRGGDFWWWWRSSRTLVDRAAPGGPAELIHETPAFSWLIGDLHAHFLALPLLLVACGLALELCRRPVRAPSLLAAALLGGAAIATNTWTLPAIALLLFAAAGFGAPRASAFGACAVALAVVLGGAAVAAPHLATTGGAPKALVVNVATPSPPLELAALWLPILPALVLLGFGAATRPSRGAQRLALFLGAGALAALTAPLLAAFARPDGAGGWLRLPAGIAEAGFAETIVSRGAAGFLVPLLLGGAVALALALARDAPAGTAGRARAAALVCAAGGLLLVLGPELVYLRDGHASRLNMVFKSHSGAWPPLFVAALAGAAGLAARGRRALALLACAPVLASGVYPAAIALDRFLASSGPATLDAFAPLAREAPAEAAAIAWIRDHVPAGARVLQAPADSYDPDALRVSVFAARPTLLGWAGHESQWRGEAFATLAAGRAPAAAEIYESPSPRLKEAALDRYGIDWIYVGPAERRRYEITERSEAALAAVAETRFERDGVVVLRRRAP